VASGARSPSGKSPISSGRRRVNRFKGASTTTTSPAIATHAVRHPWPAIRRCIQGKMTIEPTLTPENAIPIARPRRRTNQFGRKSAWPV